MSQLPDLASVALKRLQANNRCLYLNSPTMVAGLRYHLALRGLDVRKEVEKGSLVLSSNQDHLVDGWFNVNRMLQLLEDALRKALDDGYVGLWATGDMTWEMGSEKNFEKVLEYEYKLEQLLQRNPALSGVCQYHQKTVPISALASALYTHQSVFVNQTLSRTNPYYTAGSPDQPAISGSASQIGEMLKRIRQPEP